MPAKVKYNVSQCTGQIQSHKNERPGSAKQQVLQMNYNSLRLLVKAAKTKTVLRHI